MYIYLEPFLSNLHIHSHSRLTLSKFATTRYTYNTPPTGQKSNNDPKSTGIYNIKIVKKKITFKCDVYIAATNFVENYYIVRMWCVCLVRKKKNNFRLSTLIHKYTHVINISECDNTVILAISIST